MIARRVAMKRQQHQLQHRIGETSHHRSIAAAAAAERFSLRSETKKKKKKKKKNEMHGRNATSFRLFCLKFSTL